MMSLMQQTGQIIEWLTREDLGKGLSWFGSEYKMMEQ